MLQHCEEGFWVSLGNLGVYDLQQQEVLSLDFEVDAWGGQKDPFHSAEVVAIVVKDLCFFLGKIIIPPVTFVNLSREPPNMCLLSKGICRNCFLQECSADQAFNHKIMCICRDNKHSRDLDFVNHIF